MRWLLGLAIVIAACGPRAEAPASTSPAATTTATLSVAPTASPAPPTSTASPTATPPTTASGGIEVFATGPLRGSYLWVVSEEPAPQDRVSETLHVVPLDGSPARLVVRKLRPRGPALFGGQTLGGIVPLRQISADGTKLALEQSILGPAAHDGFVVVDLANGKITELARGDAKADVMPAWSPDGARIAFARRTSTPGSPDDGLWVINSDGTGIRRVLAGSCCAQLTQVYGWTADGVGIAFAVTFESAVYSVANAATGAVTGPNGEAFGMTPASWRLKIPQFAGAFSEGNKGGEQRIDIADGIGKAPRTIWHEASDFAKGEPLLLHARWSPIADEILFIRSARSGSKVVRLRLPAGVATDVALDGDPRHAEWLPDGRVALTTTGGVSVTDGARVTVLWTAPSGAVTDLAVRTYP